MIAITLNIWFCHEFNEVYFQYSTFNVQVTEYE